MDKNWKSCSLSEPNIFKIKVTFVYEIRRSFREFRRQKCENIQPQKMLNISKYYFKLFSPLIQIQFVIGPEHYKKC
jgi:hypothetical protein